MEIYLKGKVAKGEGIREAAAQIKETRRREVLSTGNEDKEGGHGSGHAEDGCRSGDRSASGS